jgi:hypothetical protein
MSTPIVGSRSLMSDVIVNAEKITTKKRSMGRRRRDRFLASDLGTRTTLAVPQGRIYADSMFVEGTLRWQVTEDAPWDLLMALALRDLGGLTDVGDPVLPAVIPAVERVVQGARGVRSAATLARTGADRDLLRSQWKAWWERTLVRESRPITTQFKPPHFAVFDRELELQDLVAEHYADALAWTTARHEEYAHLSMAKHAARASDIVDVVRDREHELRRQAGYFRLDLDVLPLEKKGAWIVAPHTIVVSDGLREDSAAFRAWFAPVVAALV